MFSTTCFIAVITASFSSATLCFFFSYMAGTNFWGTEREKDGFSAPSMDDKLMEVVGITGFTHLATTKVLGIQNQRLAQCRFAKVTLSCQQPLQVGTAKGVA